MAYRKAISSTKRDREAEEPAAGRLPRQHDRADLVGHRGIGVARPQDGRRRSAARLRGGSVATRRSRVTPVSGISRASGDPMRRLDWRACRRRRAFQIGMRIADAGQVRRPRQRVQLGQQRIIQRRLLQLRHAAGAIADLPNTIARVGQACWQAVTISPSRTGRSCFWASILAALIRCTQ